MNELTPLTIEPFGPDQLQATSDAVRRYRDQKLTLADAHGLTIMKQRMIEICWSTDRHLGLTGVPLVICR